MSYVMVESIFDVVALTILAASDRNVQCNWNGQGKRGRGRG
jgi:hypothetical protein